MRAHHVAYARFFETLSKDTSMEAFLEVFDLKATFEDPFQKVEGIGMIKMVFDHMFESLHEPKFVIDEIISSQDVAYIRWHFYFGMTKRAKSSHVVGVSRVAFDALSGKVIEHIDYWDAAQGIYSKLPLIGGIVRFIKRHIAL